MFFYSSIEESNAMKKGLKLAEIQHQKRKSKRESTKILDPLGTTFGSLVEKTLNWMKY